MSEVPPTPESHETPAEQPVAATPEAPATEPVAPEAPTDPTPVAPTMTAPSMPGAPSSDEKMWALLAWVLGIPTGFVAPLIFFVISNEKPFAKRHAAMSLGFQIAILIGFFISGALMVVLVGILLFFVVAIANIGIALMGAMAANKGEQYDVPVIGTQIAKMFNV